VLHGNFLPHRESAQTFTFDFAWRIFESTRKKSREKLTFFQAKLPHSAQRRFLKMILSEHSNCTFGFSHFGVTGEKTPSRLSDLANWYD